MHYYYFDRGMSVVEWLAKTFKNRTWWVPELICPEVLDKIEDHVCKVVMYTINDHFGWSPRITGDDPKIFYIIDYFGKEFRAGVEVPPNTIVIKDSVWFPKPFTNLEGNQIWFNSFRKIIRGASGASVVSPYRLANNEVQNVWQHPFLNWKEVDTRFDNFYTCKKLFSKFEIPNFIPDFPTVFPMILPNRDKVLETAGLTGKLPGMWKDKYNFGHRYYDELTFIPIDSRFDREYLSELADKIKDAVE